jgi:hypothetical protein
LVEECSLNGRKCWLEGGQCSRTCRLAAKARLTALGASQSLATVICVRQSCLRSYNATPSIQLHISNFIPSLIHQHNSHFQEQEDIFDTQNRELQKWRIDTLSPSPPSPQGKLAHGKPKLGQSHIEDYS